MSARTMESSTANSDPEAAPLDDSLTALFHTALTFSAADLDEADEIVAVAAAAAPATEIAEEAATLPSWPALFNRTKGAAICGAAVTPRIGRAPGPVATCKLNLHDCSASSSADRLPLSDKADDTNASAAIAGDEDDDEGTDYATFAPRAAVASAASGWTPIGSAGQHSRLRSIRSRARQSKRIVCSTPLGSVVVRVPAGPRSPPTPGTPPVQRPMTRAEFREYAKHSLTVAADRDIRYLDNVIIPRIRREANRLVRLGEELAKQDPSTMNSARRRQYRAQYRMVHGSTAEDLAETEREYQQMYGHRLPKGVKPRFGLRV